MNKTEELGVYLLGTCESLQEGLEIFDCKEEDVDFSELDEITLLCDGCGWWYEPCEIVNYECENLCEQCLEDRGENE